MTYHPVARLTLCTCGHAGIAHYDSHLFCVTNHCDCEEFKPAGPEVLAEFEAPQEWRREVKCAVAVCDRPATVMCLCMGHYQRWRHHGTPGDTVLLAHSYRGVTCSVEGCEDQAQSRGWCKKHYYHWTRYGDPTKGRELLGHGTRQKYRNGCRCDVCRRANADYAREQRRKRRLRGTSMAQPLAEAPADPSDQEASQKPE